MLMYCLILIIPAYRAGTDASKAIIVTGSVKRGLIVDSNICKSKTGIANLVQL